MPTSVWEKAGKEARAKIAQAKGFVEEVNENAESEIDPLLVRWAKSDWSMAIACGFGSALLVMGAVLGYGLA